MLPQALQFAPYIAVAAALLLGITIGVICFGQGSRRVSFGVSWWQSILPIFQKLRSVMIAARPPRLGVIVHDPDSSKPHDLDDPFFHPEVRERAGAVIANAALKKMKPKETRRRNPWAVRY